MRKKETMRILLKPRLSETLLIHGDIRMQKQERMLSSDTSVRELEGNSGIRFEGKHPWRSASLILLLFIFLMGVASVSQLIVSQAWWSLHLTCDGESPIKAIKHISKCRPCGTKLVYFSSL